MCMNFMHLATSKNNKIGGSLQASQCQPQGEVGVSVQAKGKPKEFRINIENISYFEQI